MLQNLKQSSTTYKSSKLIASLSPRLNYVLHSSLLELYIGLGMKLKKIHRSRLDFFFRFYHVFYLEL